MASTRVPRTALTTFSTILIVTFRSLQFLTCFVLLVISWLLIHHTSPISVASLAVVATSAAGIGITLITSAFLTYRLCLSRPPNTFIRAFTTFLDTSFATAFLVIALCFMASIGGGSCKDTLYLTNNEVINPGLKDKFFTKRQLVERCRAGKICIVFLWIGFGVSIAATWWGLWSFKSEGSKKGTNAALFVDDSLEESEWRRVSHEV